MTFGPGFYGEEHDDVDRFRWMGPFGELEFAPAERARYLELWIGCEFHDLTQQLIVSWSRARACADRREQFDLVAGWAPLSCEVPEGADRLVLSASKIYPPGYYSGDSRTLAIRVRPPQLHDDPARHAFRRSQHANAVLNVQELRSGRSVLTSTPPTLGIDLYGACNVKPPCVYCEWDASKALEGNHVDTPFTPRTLEEWGGFFDHAVNLVNCSIGEPFMMKEFDELLDIFGATGKVLQMTTNGQILTDRNIERLLGRSIDLYVSLDAATPETYARLRNDAFDRILRNLRRLIAAKGGRGGLPRVHIVFMPMRANVHELEGAIRLAADLDVDRLVLRPLNYTDIDLKWERAGYRFDYQDELLPFDELVRVSRRAARLARELGVPLADQMDFGGDMDALFNDVPEQPDAPTVATEAAAVAPVTPPIEHTPASTGPVALEREEPLPTLGRDQQPACTEPWKSLYILRRGVLPCCYGGEPIAPMDQYREAWNGPKIQAIRTELARGRFHQYCLKSSTCPIVRKAQEARTLPWNQRAVMRLSQAWHRFDRRTSGRAERLAWPLRWAGVRVLRGGLGLVYGVAHRLNDSSVGRPVQSK